MIPSVAVMDESFAVTETLLFNGKLVHSGIIENSRYSTFFGGLHQ